MVRGHRSGLLSTADYNNLCQCESLDDIKLNLVRGIPSALQALRHAWLSAVLRLLCSQMMASSAETYLLH